MDHARVDGASCSTRASKSVSKMTGPPHRGPKPAGVAGLISITVTPEHKGLLKDTVDFSQYKSDSPSRPARGGRTHLMILPRKKKKTFGVQLFVEIVFDNLNQTNASDRTSAYKILANCVYDFL